MTTYSKETALYDTGAIANDIGTAGETASKYITSIDQNNGIKVHAENNPNLNYTKINAEGMEVHQNVNNTDTKVASFGASSAQIGQDDEYHTIVEKDSFSIMNGEEPVFTVDSNGGTRTYVKTAFAIHAHELTRSGKFEYTTSHKFRKNREYTFKLFTGTTQTVTKTFSNVNSSFTLTGTLNGSTNTITFTPVSQQAYAEFDIKQTVTVSSGVAHCAALTVTYLVESEIPQLNIGGVTYTDIGFVVKDEGSSSKTDVTASANTSYNIGSVTLNAGVWIVSCRARFTPTSSGAHVSQITLSNSGTPTNTALDRLYAESTYFNQHCATFIVIPTDDEPLTYYLHGTATVAGAWNRGSDAAFSIRAVKIR